MERFKVCERESKTKTFSKEGLSLQATKVDPAQARRNDARDWITATVSTLEEECEAFEAEVESLGGGSGGGGGDSKSGARRGKAKAIPPRVTHLEASAERHRAHVARLEQLLRLLDNEAIDVEDVEGVMELVDDYLARNQGGSEEAADRASATMTPDEFAEPDDLYEGLLERLDAVEAALPAVPSAVALKAHKGGGDDKGNASSSSLATAGSSSSAAGGGGSSVGGGAVSSAFKAAAVAAAAKQQLAASGVLRGGASATKDDDDDASSSSAKTTMLVRRPSTSGAELPSSPAVSRKGGLDARSPSTAGPASASAAAAAAPPPPRTAAPWAGIAAATAAAAAAASARKGGEEGAAAVGGGPGSASGTPRASSAGGAAASASAASAKVAAVGGAAAAAANGTVAVPAATTTAVPTTATPAAEPSSSLPSSSSSTTAAGALQPPPTLATQSPIIPPAPPAVLQSLLAACAPRSIPTPADSSWSRIPPRRRALNGDGKAASSADGSASSPASPAVSGDPGGGGGGASPSAGPTVVPVSYPAARLPVLDNPALFERLDTEALFFAFYYQPGTHLQYLAARELKRQSWRYHKAHGAWFQRHEEPRAAGAEFERGTFVYFDYNVVHDDASAGWCYRLKQDFTFTYDQLENELQP